MDKKIKQIIEQSKQVIRDSALENGAIVAGNSDKPYYPKGAKDYHYVWPRDAGYICAAAQYWGIRDIQEPFLDWLVERPEDFKKHGKLYANYSANGRIRVHQYQPDQAGTMLWAIHEFYQKNLSESANRETLIRRLADGLVDEWKGSYFFSNTSDLWEEGHRKTSTKIENNHTYSLAACARGLFCADKMLDGPHWKEAANQMVQKINDAYDEKNKTFVRNHGKIDDMNMDASLLGLTWPYDIIAADDPRMVSTIKRMEEKIVFDGGLHRFEFDYYDGDGTSQEGAGAWPLLNFWMAIYFSLKGDKKKAHEYYDWVVDRVGEDNFIPEQIFGDFRIGIKPLVWSHAMFLMATKYLHPDT